MVQSSELAPFTLSSWVRFSLRTHVQGVILLTTNALPKVVGSLRRAPVSFYKNLTGINTVEKVISHAIVVYKDKTVLAKYVIRKAYYKITCI